MAPDSLTIAEANSVALPIPDASAGSLVPRLASGRSGSTLHDQLILSYVQTPQSSQGLTAKLVLFDLNASLQPTVEATYDLAVPYTFNLGLEEEGRSQGEALDLRRIEIDDPFEVPGLLRGQSAGEASIRVETAPQTGGEAPKHLSLSPTR